MAALIHEGDVLARFRQWGPWDAQRVGGKVHQEYIDYATFAIGLYAAAAGIPLDAILETQNIYKLVTQPFADTTKLDPKYSNLLTFNVENTEKGYQAFMSGQIKGDEAK